LPTAEREQYELVCRQRFDRHAEKLDKILSLLQGNGGIGLCETVRTQDKRISAIENEHTAIKQTVTRYFRWGRCSVERIADRKKLNATRYPLIAVNETGIIIANSSRDVVINDCTIEGTRGHNGIRV
jgi:hypothetical protein